MAFELGALRAAVAAHGRVARVVVAGVAGSAPREVGAAMLVWEGGQSGTIGGGALELMAAEAALTHEGLSRHPLGPSLGQCCGGAVTLLTEIYDAEAMAALEGREVIARGPGEAPLAVTRLLDRARARGERPRAAAGAGLDGRACRAARPAALGLGRGPCRARHRGDAGAAAGARHHLGRYLT